MNIDKWKKKPLKKELYDIIKVQEERISELNKEIERLNNIIKEVRMFAEEYKKEWVEYDEVQKDMDKLLQILNKGDD